MKTIIAGSRTITDYDVVLEVIKKSNLEITEVVSGVAQGVDTLGITYAYNNDIPIAQFPANWNKHGKSAGYIRNVEMAQYADALIAVWDGKSKGTKNMIEIANKRNLKVYIEIISKIRRIENGRK